MGLSITNSTYKGYDVSLYEFSTGKDPYYQYTVSHEKLGLRTETGKRFWDKRLCVDTIIKEIEDDIHERQARSHKPSGAQH